jgi:hypothetical protein
MLRRVEAGALVQASRRTAFAVLADYDLYADWLPGVIASRVLAREGGVAVVELGAPRYPGAEFVFECVESQDEALVFRQLDRYGSRGLGGRVTLEEAESGRACAVRASLELEAPFWSLRAGARARRDAARALAALRERVAWRAAASESVTVRRLIFSAQRRQGTLEVRVGDEVFRAK